MSDNLVGRSEHLDLAVAKPQTAMAHPAEVSHLVIYHDHGMALFEDRFYPLEAFLFKRCVSYRMTSSKMTISGLRFAATEKAKRMYIPLE